MINSIITFLPCSDIEKMHAFYSHTLDLRLHKDQGVCRIYKSGFGFVGFCNHYQVTNPVGVVCFVVDTTEEVDKLFVKIISLGGLVENEPVLKKEFGIYQFYALDPSGNRIEIQCFID